MTPTEFMDKILLHFPPFRWTEEQEKSWSETLVQEVYPFTAAARERAAKTMVRTRDKGTPSVAKCVAACVEAKRWIDIEEGKSKLPLGPISSSNDTWSAERIRFAYELCHTALGRQAAREGWVFALWNFCREGVLGPDGRREHRHPNPKEIERLKKQAAEHRQLVEQLHRESTEQKPKPNPDRGWIKLGDTNVVSSLAALGDSMLAKERRIATEVLAGKSGGAK